MTAPTGLSNRDYLNVSLAGLASALLFLGSAGTLLFSPPLYTAALMPLYGAAIYTGWLSVLVAGGVGTLVVSAVQPPVGSLGIYFGSVVLAPAVLAYIAMGNHRTLPRIDGRQLGRALAALAVIGAMVGAGAVVMLESSAGQAGVTSDMIRAMWAQAVAGLDLRGLDSATAAAQRAEMVEQFNAVGDGAFEMAFIELGVLCHILAAALVTIFAGRARGPQVTPRFSSVTAPRWLLGAIALAGIATLLAGEAKVAPLVALAALAMPFLIEGLAVLHVVSRHWPMRALVLTLAYVGALFVPLVRFVLTLVGMADHWLEWRKKVASRPDKGA